MSAMQWPGSFVYHKKTDSVLDINLKLSETLDLSLHRDMQNTVLEGLKREATPFWKETHFWELLLAFWI